jgi:hypothetical protein
MKAPQPRSFPKRALAAWTILIAAALFSAGCERIAPIRTLPSWVRGIYIPMAENVSFEPAVEEQTTRLTQEAFLADGQVDVVRKADADATLRIKITDWQRRGAGTSGDRITSSNRITVTATVRLVEPFNEDSIIADLGSVTAFQNFNVDTRSVRFIPEPDQKDQLLRALANQIVQKTLSGFPASVAPYGNAAPPPTMPEDIRSQDILRGRQGTGY